MAQTDTSSCVSFSWDLHYTCNYRCPYCWWYGRWEQLSKENVYPPLSEVLKIWSDIYKRYGEGHIEILGGEPFVYPNFNELVKELSGMHTIGITTNLSVSVDGILKNTSPSRVSVTPTFHPLYARFEDFIERSVLLKQDKRGSGVAYLAYPPQIKLIPHYKDRFMERGIDLKVMTFWGEYNGKAYPQGYSDEEKRFIDPYLGKTEGEKFQLEPRKVKGELCKAGQVCASIKTNGDVSRCGGNMPRRLGNIFKGDFELLGGPTPCESDICPCNEWASYLVKEKKKEEEEIKKETEADASRGLSRGYILEVIEPRQSKKKEITTDRKKITPHRVFFTWDIHYACNYRCTYCNTPKPGDKPECWDRDRMKVSYPPIEQLIAIWRDIYDRYGPSEVHITGGEPFTYPDFFKFIKELSRIHTIEIITNLAFNVSKLIGAVAPNRLRLGTTFHPEFAKIDRFSKKVKALKDSGYEVWVNYVAYPPILKDMFDYKLEIEKTGAPFNIMPYIGDYENRKYPSGYTEEELGYLKKCYDNEDIVNKKTIEWKTELERRNMKGRPCRMGQMYAKIYPVGDAYRCCANGSTKIGNLFDGTFELLNESLPCECDHCFCWRCMLAGEEANWGQHWVIPHGAE